MRRILVSIIGSLALVLAGTLAAPGTSAAGPSGAGESATIGGGFLHSLMIGPDGQVYGSGLNDDGQLTGVVNRFTLTVLSGLPDGVRASAVAAGAYFSLVVGEDGSVYGTGSNSYGQLTGPIGTYRTSLAELTGLPAGVSATAVAAGNEHSLVLGDDGAVYGTGGNWYGQITGNGGGYRTSLAELTGLPGGVSATAIAAGYGHSLVLGDDGTVYGAGWNSDGQLTVTGDDGSTLTALTGLPDGVHATAIAAGEYFSLVLGDDGTVYGTGDNADGQLTGTGGDDGSTLTALTGLPDGVHATAIAAGEYFSLVLGDDGTVYGTGDNADGQLTGTGDKATLTALTGLPAGITEIATGSSFALFRAPQHLVYGLGDNWYGALTGAGDPVTVPKLLATQVRNTAVPTIAGTAQCGQTLTATPGTWEPTGATPHYQWLADDVIVAGATGARYSPAMATIGKQISVTVVATIPSAVPGTATSASTAPVGKGVAPRWTAAKRPAIKGTPKAGRKLRIANLNLTGFDPDAVTLSYQWLRGGEAISGRTGSTYKVVRKDRGKSISVRITAHRPGHLDGTLTTAAVKIKTR